MSTMTRMLTIALVAIGIAAGVGAGVTAQYADGRVPSNSVPAGDGGNEWG